LDKSEKDIEKDVLEYSRKHRYTIDQNSKVLFDIWIDVALVHCTPELTRHDTATFDQYAKSHWNSSRKLSGMDDNQSSVFPVTYSGWFGTSDESI